MIYISSSCIKKDRIARVVKSLAESGIRNIELSGGTGYYEEIEYDLKVLKERYRLTYACHAYFPPPKKPFVVNLASCNDEIYQQSVEHYNQCIKMLKHIDCRVLSVHAGFMVEVGTDEIGKKLSKRIVYDEGKAYDRFCSAYRCLSQQCIDSGIALFLENNVLDANNYREFGGHNYMMMTDYSSIMKMREQLDFNLLLDLGHLYVSARTLGLDFQWECSNLDGYAEWIHLSENNGVFDEHKPLREDSKILQEFRKMVTPNMNVTLETAGDIYEILQSMQLVQIDCLRKDNNGTQENGM